LEKVQKLHDLGINPYPSKTKGTTVPIVNIRESHFAEASRDDFVEVAGRLMSYREHGNIIFADLKDESGKIQLLFQKKTLEDNFKTLKLLDVGDFLYAKGKVFKTQAGETTVDVIDYQLLSKSIRPLPSTWHGLKDVEERYRKRYLDLMFNPDVKIRFDTRVKLVREIRRYLDDLGYSEVETPTLQPLYGGANAKPFKTYHNALDSEFYLRIADELYLKRLIVAGYEKVYEICKDFRNEGIDQVHSPEFTMIEYYAAYTDYQNVMDVTEGLFKHLAQKLFGEMKIKVDENEIDIGKSWPRISMVDIVKDNLEIDVNSMSLDELNSYCKDKRLDLVGGETKGQLIFLIFDKLISKTLMEPTWIIDYPRDVSPLSKLKDEVGDWVERFEGYIGGKEICDGWSELTDPIDQRERFEDDVKAARKDKEEAQQVDEDFIEAMNTGMPPIGGIGIGIDRLTMFFTNTWMIKEVILFPTLKPGNKE